MYGGNGISATILAAECFNLESNNILPSSLYFVAIVALVTESALILIRSKYNCFQAKRAWNDGGISNIPRFETRLPSMCPTSRVHSPPMKYGT